MAIAIETNKKEIEDFIMSKGIKYLKALIALAKLKEAYASDIAKIADIRTVNVNLYLDKFSYIPKFSSEKLVEITKEKYKLSRYKFNFNLLSYDELCDIAKRYYKQKLGMDMDPSLCS